MTTERSGTTRMAATGSSPPLSILALLALLTAATLELVRTTPPLLEPAFDIGVPTAAAVAIATYLVPGLLGVTLVRVTRGSDTPTVLLIGVLLLAATRIVVQGLTADARFAAGMATIALALTVLTFVASAVAGRAGGGRSAAGAIAAGTTVAVGIQLALGTWDAYWRHDLVGWGVTGALMIGLITCAVAARQDPETAPVLRTRRMWVLGPVLGLTWMMLGNPAFASSQSGVRLVVAGPATALGLLFAGSLLALVGSHAVPHPSASPQTVRLGVAAAPAALIAGVLWANGALVLVLLIATQVAVFAALASALEPIPAKLRGRTKPEPQPLVCTSGSASLVGMGTILPLLVFQLDYDMPLGFPNELVIVAAALVLGASVLGSQGVVPKQQFGEPLSEKGQATRAFVALLVGAGAMALAGSAIAVARIDSPSQLTSTTAETGPLTLVSWNLHYGVDPTGDVDLERIARSIEDQGPSIVTLQEVSRGWTMGGGVDMATWLADRLDMRFVALAPGADRQFGNVILTNLPTTNTAILALPFGDGPQNRSAVSTDLLAGDVVVRVTSVHLQNRPDNTPTRLAQLETLLRAEGDAPVMIVAGDFNAQPGWPEIETMTGAGLISAQDAAGDPTALTDPSTEPVQRIDWVFGRGVAFTEATVLADALSSDHLPLAVTFVVNQR